MSANEILQLGGALQVDVLLIPDTTGVGHGNPPKYYVILSDQQGKFYKGPEIKLPGGKPAGVGGGNPNAGACTGGLIWQNTGDDIYKCPPTGNTGFGNLEPKKKVHITSVHTTGCLACESHQGMRLEDILNNLSGNQLSSAAWDIEPIASSGNLQIKTPGNSIPVITFTEGGNVGIGTQNPVQMLHLESSQPIIYLQNTGTTHSGIRLGGGSAGNGKIIGIYSTGSGNAQGERTLVFRSDSDSTDFLLFDLNTGRMRFQKPDPSLGSIQSIDATLDIRGEENALILLEGKLNGGGKARAHIAIAACNTCFSNQSLEGDVVISTGSGNTGNLLLQSTRPNKSIKFLTAGTDDIDRVRVVIDHQGKVIIGTKQKTGAFADALLQVDGKIVCSDEIVVTTTGWNDYVLFPDYPLPDLLSKVKPDILKYHSLDGIPTTKEVVSKGIHLGDISKALVKKVEEIFLYLIEMKEEINAMMNDIFTLKNNDARMQEEINELKKKNEMLENENIEMKSDIKEIKQILFKLNKKSKQHKKEKI